MASVLGVAARTDVVGANTVVAAAVGGAGAGAEPGPAADADGFAGIDAVAVFVVWGAASGRDAAHAAAPVVTSRAATTDT